MFKKVLDGFTFIAPSKRMYKKYDVYDENDFYITSFGDNRYQQYRDLIGYYANKDHNDEFRRMRYRLRHKNDKLNEFSAGYFSYYYLW
jgi:hypothetical protein